MSGDKTTHDHKAAKATLDSGGTLVWGSHTDGDTVSLDLAPDALAACPNDPAESGQQLTTCQVRWYNDSF